MIFLGAIAAVIISIVFLIFSPLNGILVTVMFKSFIDTSWQHSFLGISCLEVVAVALPLFIFPRIIWDRETRFFHMPLAVIGTAYFASNLVGFSSTFAMGSYYGTAKLFFKILNGFLGFFMFQFYFSDREKFRKLLFFLLLAGLFPMFVGIYQALTGQVWHSRQTVGLVRNVGLYHDAFSVRAFGFQTLTAILLSWVYFSTRNPSKKFVLSVYGISYCVVLFKAYSKAAIVILVAWVLLWSILNKKTLWLLIIPIGILSINYASENMIYHDVERIFMKEIGAYEGTMDKEYILSGRTIGWKYAWDSWKKKAMFDKFFGTGTNPTSHNEFLRILYLNGILGLSIFVIMLVIIGWKLSINMFRRATPLNVMGIMIYAMWIVDTIGLHPGMYPAYQWYVWGFVGLALKGVKGLDVSNGGAKSIRALAAA